MKKIVLVGGCGEIGTILRLGLNDSYQLVVLDRKACPPLNNQFVQVDVLDYDAFLKAIPSQTDVLINLLSVPVDDGLVDLKTMNLMVDAFFKTTYHILQAAVTLGIKRVIFSSSNHVTDYYEQDIATLQNKKIDIDSYPYSKGLYGTLKLASENIGHAFATSNPDLSVINLRIGTVRIDQQTLLKSNLRAHYTLLSHEDTIDLYRCSIESNVKFGTYYGVSHNDGVIWETKNAQKELGFHPTVNAQDIHKKGENQ